MVEMVFHGAHEGNVLLVDGYHLAGVPGLVLFDTNVHVAFGETDLEVATDFSAEEIFLAKQVDPAFFR